MVLEDLLPQITDDDYYLCMNKKCDVAYYNRSLDVQINKDQINVPIWFKEDADPKYICYCSQVTEEAIINAVKNEGARDLKDIIKITGAMKNCNCLVNHPTGKCCSPIIQEVIRKAL